LTTGVQHRAPCGEKNHRKKENHVRSEFYGSVPLINAVTIIWAVGYNGDNTSFATYLTCLRVEITSIAINSYDISELKLQALWEIVTIPQS
jgi:hypothetical protein